MATLLGFDFGTKKIGVAVGQTVSGTATPLMTIRYRGHKPDWARIEALVGEWQPEAAVVGLPFRMDDTEEDWTDRIRRFARQLQGRFGLAVHLVDERLTTLAAERHYAEQGQAGLRALQRQPDLVDAYAAKLILETWLNEH
ncbi:Holliday junction resolvase RuvX [Thiohalocapsa marina]|uniref:Putative pre-16S rRNA nuclease n=1 Tax=Thiohalocapsa marina TaxID=424902 RepID=A0A5M8FNX8_9GAMM|nr:Holliday junction resolvase RuvX [Thiohalocapsa marina]KAA6185376.1 Holliday junction resolvase RuvX [Thiohalocapsa marina]